MLLGRFKLEKREIGKERSRSATERGDGMVEVTTIKSQRKDRQEEVKEYGVADRLRCIYFNVRGTVW